MGEGSGDLGSPWWAKNLDEVDREVARLSILCNVKILDPGIIERVLRNDASVCGSNNPAAFEKLRSMLMMHYTVRDKAVRAIGQDATSSLVTAIIERLQKSAGDKLGGSPKV